MASSSYSSSSSTSSSDTLIPGLPNDISTLILSSLPIPHQSRLKPTSKSFHSFLSSPSPFLLRRRHRHLRRHLLCLFPSDPSLSPPFLFDPFSLSWVPLPPLPVSPHLFSLSNFAPLFLFPHLYILGGSHFDARSYPLNYPLPSAAAYRLDLTAASTSWSRVPNMISPRGSFACVADEGSGTIVVAGGGSRHRMYPSEGSRIGSVEVLDVERGEWRVGEGMGRRRAGCVGFVRGEEFWVMGGYGEYRAVHGVVPRDVYCRDAVVMGLRSGQWREVGDMWEEGERRRLGKVGVVVEEGKEEELGVFMLDRNEIFRYDFAANRWVKETSLRRKVPSDESCCFIGMNGELYVLTSDSRRSPKKKLTLEVQVYNPNNKKWKFQTTSPPFHSPIDFKTAISCTIQL